MFRKPLQKFSAFLLRGHHAIERRLAAGKAVAPKRLHYETDQGLPRIIHFNGNFLIGGTSQLIADIIEKTSDHYFHEVIVPGHPRPLPYQPLPVKEFPLSGMQALHDYLATVKPALVHIHYWIRPMHRYADFGLWYKAVFEICAELGIKVIQNIDVPTAPFPGKTVIHNVFVSHYVKNEFNNSGIPSSVIYPGSDLSHFSCADDFPFPAHVIGMVYRLDTDKLNEKVIEIFIKAVRLKPALYCYIIGGGYYLEYFKKRVREEGLNRHFEFTGFVPYDELPAYYKKLGLILAPVHDESFGQVTPFAMSMGLPVAGFDTGALQELLGGKEMLVPGGDVEGLARLAVTITDDIRLRKKAGAANKQRARALFSIEQMISDYLVLYRKYV